MELEDLMTNRSLLEKISEDSMHGNSYRKHPKQVVIQEHSSNHSISSHMHHVKPPPKDIRIEYTSKTNKTGYKEQNKNDDDQSALILEGYGCKCPKKLMKTIKILWIMLLVLYVFGMPIVMQQLFLKLKQTKDRLQKLEHEFDKHIPKRFDVQASQQRSENYMDRYKPTSSLAEKLLETHLEFSKFRTSTNKHLEKMRNKIKDYEKRLDQFAKFAAMMNKTYQAGQNCSCQDIPKKEDIESFIKGQCKCSSKKLKQLVGEGGTSTKKSAREEGMNADINLTCTQCGSNFITSTAVYTRWGKSSCTDDKNTTTVYHGYIGSSFHTHEGGGSNYLCLPSNPKYNKLDPLPNNDNRGYIHGAEFELGDSSIFDTSLTTGYYDALCSVCEKKHRNNALMIPGTIICPEGWKREYHGYLMAQKKYLKRTQYICVDHQPDLIIGTGRWGKGAFLHFVETRCGVLPCKKGSYKDNLEITCAVCTK